MLTGRRPARALLGAVVVALAAPRAGVVVVTACVAGPRRHRRRSPAGPVRCDCQRPATAVRLGETATGVLLVSNDERRRCGGAGPRRLAAVGRRGRDRRRSTSRPGERRRLTDDPAPDPARRPAGRPGHGPGDRAARAGGRQGSHAVPWTLRVLPPFTSRRHLPSRMGPAAGARRPVGGAGPRAGHRVRLAARVRRRRRRPLDRLAATARAADVVVRTWRPERDRHVLSCSTPAGRRPAGSATPAARRGDGRRPAAGGAGHPRR